MKRSLIPILIPVFILNQACVVPNKSFVASSFEQVTVKQKGDMEISASLRPFKFYKFNATVATSEWMAVRAGYSGFPRLNNFDGSLIFFKDFKKAGIFIAPTYNYQNNTIQRSYSLSFFGIGRTFEYKCVYNSPGLVLGFRLFGRKGNSHQLILKTSYNLVNRYNYYFSSNTASGKNADYYVKDEETLNYKIPDFFSFEPSYSLVISRPDRKLAIRYQIGLNICQQVLIHKYTFNTRSYGGPQIQEGTNFHPVFFPINVSVGLIFKHRLKKEPGIE